MFEILGIVLLLLIVLEMGPPRRGHRQRNKKFPPRPGPKKG